VTCTCGERLAKTILVALLALNIHISVPGVAAARLGGGSGVSLGHGPILSPAAPLTGTCHRTATGKGREQATCYGLIQKTRAQAIVRLSRRQPVCLACCCKR